MRRGPAREGIVMDRYTGSGLNLGWDEEEEVMGADGQMRSFILIACL